LTGRLSHLNTRQSNTIDNVKAKIDNVKAKIQDKEEKGPWSRSTLARHPVYDQLAASLTSSPLEGPPRQVSASHDKSPPRTTSLRLTRQVSALHDKSLPHTTSLRLAREVWLRLASGPRRAVKAHSASTTTDKRVEERFPTSCKYNSWRPCRQLSPTRALMLV
jgi:hypothetical protein